MGLRVWVRYNEQSAGGKKLVLGFRFQVSGFGFMRLEFRVWVRYNEQSAGGKKLVLGFSGFRHVPIHTYLIMLLHFTHSSRQPVRQ